MLRTWLTVGVLVTGLVGCGDSGHGDGDLSGAGDNLKGRDKNKPTEADDDAGPADAGPAKDGGSVKDEPTSACAALLCPTNTKCVVKEVQCVRAPCPPIASCEPIDVPVVDAGVKDPPASCAATLCKVGTTCVEGPNGAECVEQKCTAKCSADQHCELQEVVCIKAPCLPVPTCVDDVVDACATVKCKGGYHCESTQPQCFTTPCPPFAECIPN
ncbi:MAG TPA: hypothetical protein VFX59_19665 [Polyangiales bacterium]|nr:hypothetical protein [Polyangiales bacterium]